MKRFDASLAAAAIVIAFAAFPISPAAAQSSPQGQELAGLASVSGTVTSPVPFRAARVYFRNAEKRVQYMVYTAGG